MASKDLHEHIALLEANGMLLRITRPINKDTELNPLCRLQFLSLPEKQRRAFLFENVVDSKGRHYDTPVLIGAMAASEKMYEMGIDCKASEVLKKIDEAISRPIEPHEVTEAPVQEVVVRVDKDENAQHGFDLFPIPISTPGFDPAPFLTCAQWVTEDPATGERNVGNYRAHIKSPTRCGLKILGPQQDIFIHIKSAVEMGVDLPVAIVIGGPPALNYAATLKAPRGMDEIGVAGAMMGESIPVVRCKTSNLMVPANAEIVFEGVIKMDELEIEGPFGEYHGYMNPSHHDLFMELKCVTYRKDAIFETLLSQAPPTESSVMLGINANGVLTRRLVGEMGIKSVKEVYCYNKEFGAKALTVIQFDNPANDEVVRAMMAAASAYALGSKMIVAVDSDIDPRSIEKVLWAISVRCEPDADMQIIRGFKKGPLPPFGPLDEEGNCTTLNGDAPQSVVLIDATLRGRKFSPVSLPRRQYMERACEIWKELGLPELDLSMPWYGYDLGGWSEKLTRRADMATAGDYFELDEYYRRTRVPFTEYYTLKKPARQKG
ncbi:MAG: UbiD family decarboxylase [Cloacibacillus sp.]